MQEIFDIVEKLADEGKSDDKIAEGLEKEEESDKIKEQVKKLHEKEIQEMLRQVDHSYEEEEEDYKKEIDNHVALQEIVDNIENTADKGRSEVGTVDSSKEKEKCDEFTKQVKTLHEQEVQEKHLEGDEIDEIEEEVELIDNGGLVSIQAISGESAEMEKFEEQGKVPEEKVNELEDEEFEKLKELYRKKTGQRPMYAGKESKGFSKWLEELVEESRELAAKFKEQEEQEEEGWQKTLKKWLNEDPEQISNELKKILLDIIHDPNFYERIRDFLLEFSKVVDKFEKGTLSDQEREIFMNNLNDLMNTTQIHLNLYENLRAFRDYFDEHSVWNPDRISHIKKPFLSRLTQKFKSISSEIRKNTKTCGYCGEILPLSEFEKDGASRGKKKGLQSYRSKCKKCRKDDINNETIDYLIKSLEKKKIPNRDEIIQKKLIANQRKFQSLKQVVIEQLREYVLSQKKKYGINEIKEKIGYKSNDTRIRNTIKDLIGKQLYKKFFEGHKQKYNLEDLFHLAEIIGKERYGIPGIVTQRGVKMFLKDIKAGISSSKARTEIWCQREGHPFFTPVIYKLVHERSWCINCYADERMKSYDEILIIGTENGWILNETIDSWAKLMKNRGSKSPKDIRLNWKCLVCGTPKKYTYNNIQKKTEGEASGCKICFSRNLEITKIHAENVAREKGIELNMTDEEFENAKEEMRKQNRAPAHAKLIWKIHGNNVPLTFNYVAYLMKSKARYRFINYISPTGHRSSEGENFGRKVLQKLFGGKFDHTLLREIVGEEVTISGKNEKIHPRSHVDGYNIITIKGKDFKIVYEFWELYHHNYYNSKTKDAFKKILFEQEGIILIILTDEQDPINYQQIIAKQFQNQTGFTIQHEYQENLDMFIERENILFDK